MILAAALLLAAAAATPQDEALAAFQRELPDGGSATLYVLDEGDWLGLRIDLMVGAEDRVLPRDASLAGLHSFAAHEGNRWASTLNLGGSPRESARPAGNEARRQVLAAGSSHSVDVGSLELRGLDPLYFEAEWSCLGQRFSERGCRQPLTPDSLYLGPIALDWDGILVGGSLWVQGRRPLALLRFQNVSGHRIRWRRAAACDWSMTVVRAGEHGKSVHSFLGGYRRCGPRGQAPRDDSFPPGAVRRAVVRAGALPGQGLPLRFELRLRLFQPERPASDLPWSFCGRQERCQIGIGWEPVWGTGTRVVPLVSPLEEVEKD